MNNTLKTGILILLIGAIGLFGAGYVFSESALVPETGLNNLIGSELLVLLLQIKSINLDTGIFDDNAFTRLKDFGVEIEPQPIGKSNPFTSIGVGITE